MPKKKTTEEFIADARKVHGDRYDYSKVVYDGVYKPITIICPIHGEFRQRPYNHLTMRNGCPKCGNVENTVRQRKPIEYFLSEAHRIHGNKYDYSHVHYVDLRTNIEIGCPKHGFFMQSPTVHLKTLGCPQCGREQTGAKLKGSTDGFIKKATERFGNLYDYSSVQYVNASTPVEITCRRHGPFRVLTYEHLNGDGCPSCKCNKQFIESARRVHGDRYDYSKVEYIDIETPVIISCQTHGDFQQRPHTHLRGRGCPKCGIESRTALKRNTTEGFIEDARKIHGDEYDYSKVHYAGCDTPVEIICKIHGSFMQTPYGHNNMGAECPICSAIKRGAESRKTQEQFIQEARLAHGDKYDYSLVEYTGSSNKVKIICPVHGVFEQIPGDHIKGIGCNKCYVDSKRKTLEQLIEEFNQVHHDKYGYDKVVYKNVKTKILVTCPTHGDFWTRPDQHLEGYGCHQCAIHESESRLERSVRKVFERKGYMFEQQKSFPWLKDKNPLFLDFYLPEYNVAIECQGAQHFKAYDFFGGEKNFKTIKKRDEIKRSECEKNGVSILYYSDLGIDYPYLVTEDLGVLFARIDSIGKTDHPVWMPYPLLPFDLDE